MLFFKKIQFWQKKEGDKLVTDCPTVTWLIGKFKNLEGGQKEIGKGMEKVI